MCNKSQPAAVSTRSEAAYCRSGARELAGAFRRDALLPFSGAIADHRICLLALSLLLLLLSTQHVAAFTTTRWSFNGEWRTGFEFLDNNDDLDSADSQDRGWQLTGHFFAEGSYAFQPWLRLFSRLELRGPSDYDLVIAGQRIQTVLGESTRAQGAEFIPEVSRLWLQGKLLQNHLTIDGGLLPATAGDSLALNNKHENYGVRLAADVSRLTSVITWQPLGYNVRYRLGHERDEDLARIMDKTTASFTAASLAWSVGRLFAEAYATRLDDDTPASVRTSAFQEPVDRDRLSAYGSLLKLDHRRLQIELEAAHNFGAAEYESKTVYRHRGYFYRGFAQAFTGMVRPFASYLCSSGNRMREEDYYQQLIAPGVTPRLFKFKDNREFSFYSPSNLDLYATRYPAYYGPFVATGSLYGATYGVPRPGTFGDPHLPTDLRAGSIGLELLWPNRFDLVVSYWRLASFAPALGIVNGALTQLNRDLGKEFDVGLYFPVGKQSGFQYAVQAGWFVPGHYYRTTRDDADPYRLFPVVNADHASDKALAYELSLFYRW